MLFSFQGGNPIELNHTTRKEIHGNRQATTTPSVTPGTANGVMGPTLADLPDDILLLVLISLESARDFRALALSCRRLHRLITGDGWRVFVRSKFPSLSVPLPSRSLHGWQQMAESLTWQSRSWDKRALQFQALLPRPEPGRDHRRRGGLFQPVIDAHFDPETDQELVIWGAGENIVARYRQRRAAADGIAAPSSVLWLQSEGKDLGFTAGYDDVRALSIIKDQRYPHPVFLAGRDNGDLALLSAGSRDFGRNLVRFRPELPSDSGSENGFGDQEQDTINSVDVLQSGPKTLLATATKSSVFLYSLPDDDSTETAAPETIFDLRRDVFETASTQLCRATWMEGQGEVLALALKGCKEPLRYITITPTGWTHHAAAKNTYVENMFNIGYGNICPNSLTPVQPPGSTSTAAGGTNLLLSAWRDGTCRLQDLRTPSSFDTVYQDNVDPWADMESLMTYGAERFVGGGMNGAAIKIFDFRWTKTYFHTSGLSCMDSVPFSQPSQPFLKPPNRKKRRHEVRCNHVLGTRCYWHELSRHIYYRPNASFFLSNSLPRKYSASGIWSLTKPSDISPNFYIGISGGIIEATLEPSPESSAHVTIDPNFGFQDWRETGPVRGEVDYESLPLGAAMMETGDGFAFRQNDRAIRFPRMWTPRAQGLEAESFKSSLRSHHRLDHRYQIVEDYWPESFAE
ncbi:hypothetical protein B0H66DRAFT_293414 [Apodospora peruviana]|uniref:F-box domain-containing protein n=1 Tax=Apodospora peruviana TaxID=516989 RepID=A0AAE0I0Q7_9PEZI|nr:hypothetical protein B0H66DRAFT_293414 [Apodospora peruviana]